MSHCAGLEPILKEPLWDDSSQLWAQTSADAPRSGANPLVLIWLTDSDLRRLLLLLKAGRHNVSGDVQTN